MKPTKQHIKDQALSLFNTNGFVNVRLQHIADAAFVSVGHLAYHVKNKEQILEELYDELNNKQMELLNAHRVVPLFEDINVYLADVFRLQSDYIFFYLDTLELCRAYPGIHAKHMEYITWQIAQLKMMIAFNCSRGAFIALSELQQNQLAWHIRSVKDMWLYIKKVEGNTQLEIQYFLNDIWSVIFPFCTDIGKTELLQLNYKMD